MIAQIKVLNPDLQKRIGQTQINFTPNINIVVGSNGCGKSSLLRLLTSLTEQPNADGKLIWDSSIKVHTYSSEQVTRTRVEHSDTAFGSVHESHGQALRKLLSSLENIEDEAIVLLDEPETALDFQSVWDLCKIISTKKNVQFIISTHHPLLLTLANANFINLDREDKTYAQTVLKKLAKRLK